MSDECVNRQWSIYMFIISVKGNSVFSIVFFVFDLFHSFKSYALFTSDSTNEKNNQGKFKSAQRVLHSLVRWKQNSSIWVSQVQEKTLNFLPWHLCKSLHQRPKSIDKVDVWLEVWHSNFKKSVADTQCLLCLSHTSILSNFINISLSDIFDSFYPCLII